MNSFTKNPNLKKNLCFFLLFFFAGGGDEGGGVRLEKMIFLQRN